MVSPLYRERLERCSEAMLEENLDVLLLTKPANMFYLTGDGRLCAYAMVTRDGRVALGVPSTDVEDVRHLAHFDHIAGFEDEVGMIHSIAHHFETFGIRTGRVGLEYTFLTQAMLGMMTHPHAKPKELETADCTHVMSHIRMIKDEQEVGLIASAGKVAVEGMKAAIRSVRPGITESQVAAEAEYSMRNAGAEGFWRTYVCSGARTNIAHGLPTNKVVEKGDLVMIDLHPIVNNYSADICRTVCLGEPTQAQRQAFDLYLKAQQSAVAVAKAGSTMMDLERAVNGTLDAAGHKQHVFGPPVHGLGIEFEEAPLPAGHAFFHGEKAAPPLEANTVLAIGNCGLYTGPWGVRVEDTVVVGIDGPVVLTDHPRRLTA